MKSKVSSCQRSEVYTMLSRISRANNMPHAIIQRRHGGLIVYTLTSINPSTHMALTPAAQLLPSSSEPAAP